MLHQCSIICTLQGMVSLKKWPGRTRLRGGRHLRAKMSGSSLGSGISLHPLQPLPHQQTYPEYASQVSHILYFLPPPQKSWHMLSHWRCCSGRKWNSRHVFETASSEFVTEHKGHTNVRAQYTHIHKQPLTHNTNTWICKIHTLSHTLNTHINTIHVYTNT